MTSAIALHGASVRFPRRPDAGLRDVHLEVAAGERVLLLGPSGGGKSTLLNVLTGVLPQSVYARVTGDVQVLGRDPRVVPAAPGQTAQGCIRSSVGQVAE